MTALHDIADWSATKPARRGIWSALIGLAVAAAIIMWLSVHFDLTQMVSDMAAAGSEKKGAGPLINREQLTKLQQVTEGAMAQELAAGEVAEEKNDQIPALSGPVETVRPFILHVQDTSIADRAELCLTQAVYYEAGFEPAEGKRAVAQVVLNRMRHPAFPKSVCGVVYQGSNQPVCQFSFTCDGSLNRTPGRDAWASARAVARAALAGYVEKAVGTATHYHANYVLPRWAYTLGKITKIGAHIFYRWPGNWGRRYYFNSNYSGSEFIPARMVETETDSGVAFVNLPPDPTDRRAPNDVGGRLDVSKGWVLNIPDPTATRSQFQKIAGTQQVSSASQPDVTLAEAGK